MGHLTNDNELPSKSANTKNVVLASVMPSFSVDDLDCCWRYHKDYLIDILNGDYDLDKAREDLSGLIGSEFDCRT